MNRRSVLCALSTSFACPNPLLALPVSPSNRAESVPGEALIIGLTAVILADQAAFLSRWSEYLSLRLGARVSFVARESYQEILDMLFSSRLDAAWICGYPFVRHQARLRLLAIPLYQGQPLYRAYLIRPRVPKPRVDGWRSARGTVLAYSDPLSNSGWLVPQSQLASVGLSDRDLRKSFFAHGHRNVAEAVAAGLADAGCIDGYVWETMQRQRMAAIDHTEVIWRSGFYAFPPLVTRVDARPENGLQDALLAMAVESEGRQLLDALNLDGFVQGEPTLFSSIQQLVERFASPSR